MLDAVLGHVELLEADQAAGVTRHLRDAVVVHVEQPQVRQRSDGLGDHGEEVGRHVALHQRVEPVDQRTCTEGHAQET